MCVGDAGWTRDELIATVREAARENGLDGALICAMVEQESGWNPWAIRYEPQFYARYVVPLITGQKLSETESHARATSWGLLQVMGQVARERGFLGNSLSEMCDPVRGLEVGCRVFGTILVTENGNVDRALERWNGGARPEYAGEVLGRVGTYK